ncbi:MAG TPA: HAD family hydrolase [Bacteroidales bacterium]|nr:HAD family hydrolase [Bacteroidales bacterium]
MLKNKVLILDLDNTIYPVISIGDKLFGDLLNMIEASGEFSGDIQAIRKEIMRRPFQLIAREFSFSERLTENCLQHLKELTYNDIMTPFPDYKELSAMSLPKYLVTTGFKKMQQSKVRSLNIEKDFKSVIIVDPAETSKTKKDVFGEIIRENNYNPSNIVVIGDDPESEIKAARELGLEAILYDRNNEYPDISDIKKIRDFKELREE